MALPFIKQTLKYWWLFLLTGILLIVMSIFIIVRPLDGLVAFTFFLGFSSIISGVGEFIFALRSKVHFPSWKWFLAASVIEILFGFLLLTSPQLLITLLPIAVGMWVILRGIVLLSTSSRAKKLGLKNWKWIAVAGFLSILFALLIFFNPVPASIGVMIFIGFSILFTGLISLLLAWGLRGLYKSIDDYEDELEDQLEELLGDDFDDDDD